MPSKECLVLLLTLASAFLCFAYYRSYTFTTPLPPVPKEKQTWNIMSFQKEKKAPIKEHQKEERGKIKNIFSKNRTRAAKSSGEGLKMISHVTMVEMFAEQISQPKICRMQQGSSDAYRSLGNDSTLARFQTKLVEYAHFHRKQLQLIKNHSTPKPLLRMLSWVCPEAGYCSGLGDQFYKIELAFLFALESNRLFGIQWNRVSMNLMKYLKPNAIRWDLVGENAGNIHGRVSST